MSPIRNKKSRTGPANKIMDQDGQDVSRTI